MVEIGSGSGTSYPAAKDTNDSLETSSLKARAAVPNDLAAAIVAIQGELGVDPAGTLTDVKSFLQAEHETNGTHKSSLVAMLAGTQTFTGQKTLPSPVITGTVTGTYALGGSPTISTGAVVDTGTIVGTTLTQTLENKTIGSGSIVPLARMKVDEQTAKNSGSVTVTGSITTVVALPSLTVAVGDSILVSGVMTMSKGVTAGLSTALINKQSGTATVLVCVDASSAAEYGDQAASTSHRWAPFTMWRVTVAGTVIFQLASHSNGSDGTVAAGDGQLHALVLKGT